MRTTDERVATVRRRSRRLRRRRAGATLAALMVLLSFPLACLAGRCVTSVPAPASPAAGLFGSSSLLGPSAGGYVLVAVASFAVAVVVTALFMTRSRKEDEGEAEDERGERGKA